MTPGGVGMAYIYWQGACAGLGFRGDIFHHYCLPEKQSSTPLLFQASHDKIPNHNHRDRDKGGDDLGRCLCVFLG